MKLKDLVIRLNHCIIDKQMSLKELSPLMREYYLKHDNNELIVYEHMLRNNLKRQQDFNKHIPYINHSYEINILYWGKIAVSSVHDHPKNGCIATVMKGCLKERRYYSRSLNTLNTSSNTYLETQKKKESVIIPSDYIYLREGSCSYINGNELHDITNNSMGYTSDGNALSIHIYSPPNYYIPDNVINYNKDIVITDKKNKNLEEDYIYINSY
jgi:hypothetical protein